MTFIYVIHNMLSYNCEILAENQEHLNNLYKMLEWEQNAYNEASKIQFSLFKQKKPNSIIILHKYFYNKFRQERPEILSQVVIKAENSVLEAYRSIKSNKHKINKPIFKKNLSLRLDKHLFHKIDNETIRIATVNKRQTFKLKLYPKLKEILYKYPYKDPLLFIKNNKIFISLVFDIKPELSSQKLALGVDLGIRINAACSDGRLIKSKSFNARKREVRYLKRSLQSKGTKSANKHLLKLRHKEYNITNNFSHHLANKILQTNADTIVLENLKGLKNGYGKKQTKQFPFYRLREILTYKARNMGKHVSLVSPTFTSQTDPITGLKSGVRKGRRFYANNGLIYDADISASWNIARRSKLPYSQGNLLAGQALINEPIVYKSINTVLFKVI